MTNTSTAVSPWVGSAGVSIPASVHSPKDIVPYAAGLRRAEQQRVVQAFKNGLYAMGAEFVWRRAMSRLRSTIAGLGMDFIGEMLNRDDVDDSSSAEAILTDYDTIRLAEALGVVNATGALKLKHAFELLAHYSGNSTDEDLPVTDATSVIRSCVQFALGEENIQVAVDFSRFRDRLLSATIGSDDPQVDQLAAQPPFFLSTALRVMLAAITSEQGARLQHALGNLNTLLPTLWPRLPEADRWSIGEAYAQATSAGNEAVVAELKRALLKVAGFDYIPENLRSTTYRRAAQAVIAAHFSFGNFEGEIKPTKHLVGLGTVIPKPALPECIRALMLVYLGNYYGHSFHAAAIAEPELRRISATYWQYYFSVVLPTDDQVLTALGQTKPSERFLELRSAIQAASDAAYPTRITKLLEAAEKKNASAVRQLATRLLADYKPMPS